MWYVQYDVSIWISNKLDIYFANHKRTKWMLNALVLIFNGIHFRKKKCGSLSFCLRLICMFFHQDVKVLKFKEYNVFIYLKVFFKKNWLLLQLYFC
jgi:hypothetical protein